MIFVFIEDGTVDVIDDISEACKNYEGIDVESSVYDFYDENGTYLKPVFTKPNKYKKHLFGLFTTAESGEFTLEVAPDEQRDTFQQMIEDAQALNANRFFNTLEEIRNKYFKNT